ncbi:cyclohexanone monooxygenase [Jatrophihabitans endophyticus]|uniref:Cyclohexanone monooxygenase n=1 Tax=Jatrophihabitans endophyticus TaxID=1206085 RepID=A0A1M5HSW3_9ACTN|nr:NAD(P)/FAD-dependent oxidoreductase [Jatrophihabitans endophyticus]SHG19061.1 cyclohexanone monooxygenase [Jatrophihabitans endophyticus]
MTQTPVRPGPATGGRPRRGARRHVEVLVVGSGFAGLGAAIRLQRDGRDDFLVIERGPEVGGTWRDNTYPGAACDVPSHLYSYSFELNPDWTRSFSPQPEIQEYLRAVAVKYGVLDKHLFDTEVTSARWDASANRWLVDTTGGAFSCTVLVSAVGALAEPKLPDIPGIESFAGEIFHSARWNHDTDLAGKRVALIGTGASAIQIGPAVVDTVAHLDVYQRTAPWVMPRHDRRYPRVESLAYRHVPFLQRAAREAIYWGRESYVLGFALQPRLLDVAQQIARRNIGKAIADPELRAAVTPDWQIGCKRILISNTWYPMLARDHVDLVTDGIAEIRAKSIVSVDGTEREVDAIVVATGFHVTDSPTYERIVGKDGRSLAEVWDSEGQRAHKGAAVAGFPNLLFVVGPNTGLGHSSMVYMIESHLNYLSSALRAMTERQLATFEVRRDVQDHYNAGLQERMARTIWQTGGCASWYLDKFGNNTTLWPGFTFAFRRMTRSFDIANYDTTERSAERDVHAVGA